MRNDRFKWSARRAENGEQRRGVAAVEMALILPILLVVILGTFSVAQLIYFRKSMVIAAAEGVRLASRRTSSSADVENLIDGILKSRRIDRATITMTPANIEKLTPGDTIEVRIQAPFEGGGVRVFGLFVSTPVTVDAAILRE